MSLCYDVPESGSLNHFVTNYRIESVIKSNELKVTRRNVVYHLK